MDLIVELSFLIELNTFKFGLTISRRILKKMLNPTITPQLYPDNYCPTLLNCVITCFEILLSCFYLHLKINSINEDHCEPHL